MIGIDWYFPDWDAKIKRARNEINLFIAAQIQTNRGMLFDQEGAYSGHKKWAPLKFRRGQILSKSGKLRKSIAPLNAKGQAGTDGIVRFQDDFVYVGTMVAYARLMNDGTTKMPGGVLRAKNAKALKIPVSSSEIAKLNKTKPKEIKEQLGVKGSKKEGEFIFRKSVKIPAREFDTWTREDENELSGALRNKLLQVLNR